MRAASISAALLTVPVLAAWMLLTPSTVTSTPPLHGPPRPIRIAAPGDPDAPQDSVDVQESDGTVDLYGNEVSDAVAKYRMDTAGSLYELHSPHTELPRLGSPKS